MLKKQTFLYSSFFLELFFCTANVSIVFIDADVLTPGIQSNLNPNLGDTISVDIWISGLDGASPLNAYEFDLDFNPSVVTATHIVSAGFFPVYFKPHK